MGLHTIGAVSNEAIALLSQTRDSPTPVSVAVVVVSGQACQLIKTLSRDTWVVARPVWPDSLPISGGRVKFNLEWFNQYLDPIRPWLGYINSVQFVNEVWPGNKVTDRQILADFRDFYWDLGRACADRGIGYTVLDLAAGNMADDRHAEWGEINQFEIMAPMLEWISRNGGVLMYHPYNPLIPQHVYNPMHEPEQWVLRPVHWLRQIPTLRCIGGESLVPEWKDASGRDAVLPANSAEVLDMVKKVDGLWTGAIVAKRIRQEQFIGFAPFTDLPGQRWKDFNMQPHQTALIPYLRGER